MLKKWIVIASLSSAFLQAATIAEQNYIVAVYQDLLNRQPTGNELSFYANAFDSSSLDNYGIALTVVTSNEYYGRLVTSYYQDYLNRTPSASETNSWVPFLAGGTTDQQVQAAFTGSNEYYANRASSSNSGFLAVLYPDLLGRAPTSAEDASGLIYLSNNVGSPGRTSFAGGLLGSLEYDTNLVTGYYIQFLGHGPDSGANSLITGINGGSLRDEQAIAQIVSSAEFFNQAQPAPEPATWSAAVAVLGAALIVRKRRRG